MRRAAALLILSALVLAGEDAILHAFKVAREDPFSPRGRARMDRAIAALAKDGGPKSVPALADFLREADGTERDLRKERLAVQKRGRVAHIGMEQVTRELEHLRHRETAGATGLGPQITARADKLRAMEMTLDDAKKETIRLIRIQNEIVKKRESSTLALIGILRRLDEKDLGAAISALRKSLAVDSHDQVLLLIRVLRESNRRPAAPALLEVFSHPKTGSADKTSAACAIAHLAEPATTRLLIERLRVDGAAVEEAERARILHALGMAAKQRFKDLDAAAKWAADLK